MYHVGVITSGGDCPGLNAAIRGLCRTGISRYGMRFTGFRDGFRGLVQDRTLALDSEVLLGTSRDKPHKMPMGGKTRDMTDAAVETYKRHHLDALVCLGGGGTQKNAHRLQKASVSSRTSGTSSESFSSLKTT